MVLTRRPEVEEQIKEALHLSENELVERLALRDFRAKGFVKPEVIVYLIRYSLKKGEDALVNHLSTALIGRLTRIIAGKVAVLSGHLQDECQSDIIVSVFQEIVDLSSNKADFAQVSFGPWLNKRMFDSIRKYWKKHIQYQVTDSLTNDDDTGTNGAAVDDYDFRPNDLNPIQYKLFIKEALGLLNDNEQMAFILRHLWEWEIENVDPRIPTISRRLGVSPRTVRNWLNNADEKMQAWRAGAGA
jgi:hypothetical protein